jgi:DNA-binding response OmpR family regulator
VRVLIVDTDPIARFVLATALREEGCDVTEATSFEEGKRLWALERPAMLIADVRLGEFNGLQLLLRAKADREDIKAVITSTVPDRVLEVDTHRFGGTFLIKPVRPPEIIKMLRPAADGNHRMSSIDRRVSERRQLVTPSFAPDRRTVDRRGSIDR